MLIRPLLFLTLIFPFAVLAQTNYKDGYVITNTGDTLRGTINYLEWYNNPSNFDFRPANGNNVVDINLATAKEITINGFETYQRFEVRISMNAVSFEKITNTSDTSGIVKTVFLKQLVKGNHVDLYSYTDKLKVRFYILDKEKNTADELIYIKTLDDLQEQTQSIYRQQLEQLSVVYGTYTSNLESKIQVADYTEASLANIVGRINTNSQAIAGKAKTQSGTTSYFAGLGIMQAKINYSGSDLITSDGLDANGASRYKHVTTTNITPRIAAGINFYSKQWLHKLVVKAEFSAYRFASTVTSYTKYNNLSNAENHYTYNLSGWSFALTPQLLYKFYSNHTLKAYIGAGPGFNILATSKNSMYKVGINQPLTFNETTDDYVLLRNVNLSLTGRVGVFVNQKFDIYLYGSTPVQYNNSNPEDFSVKSGVLAFCAAYNF